MSLEEDDTDEDVGDDGEEDDGRREVAADECHRRTQFHRQIHSHAYRRHVVVRSQVRHFVTVVLCCFLCARSVCRETRRCHYNTYVATLVDVTTIPISQHSEMSLQYLYLNTRRCHYNSYMATLGDVTTTPMSRHS